VDEILYLEIVGDNSAFAVSTAAGIVVEEGGK
jgi:hypothetical protein